MDLYALLSVCASAVSISLGLSVYFLNRKSTVNKLFMLAMMTNAYWAFCTYMKTQSLTAEEALLWSKVLSFWPFLVALMLHFALAFTESDLLKNKFIYIAIYLPAAIFSVTDLTTGLISGMPALKPWGYETTIPSYSMVAELHAIWSAVLGFLVVVAFCNYYRHVGDKTKKQQTKFITWGFSVPIFLSLVTDSVFPALDINFPGLGNISGSITSFFVLYAMWRYELFTFSVEIAAENIFSTMPDSVIISNLNGKILKVNQALLDLTGYGEKEIVGKSIREMMQKATVLDRGNSTPQIMNQLRRHREIKNFEFTFYTKYKEQKIGILSSSIITDNKGDDVGVAFVFRDITERRMMEQKLIRAERFASIGELAGMLGHDLRNPLSGIRGAAYYLRRKLGKQLDEEDIAMFNSIDKSIDYSDKIINDLLDYSSEIRLQLSSVTPRGLIRDSLALTQPTPNIKVVDETPEDPAFEADEVKVCRVFVNIIKNAFDAMPNGGELQIKCQIINDKLLFTFQDSGMGMTKETVEKLWTPLFTTKAKGMGFGLPICKRHVEAHDGKISIDSVLEVGTTVKVELPIKRAP
ncbi:MAG: ATP-binding protein [Candidatus Bathyarchaeia archaeon]|jgi:PAS domain S-box-containing protein